MGNIERYGIAGRAAGNAVLQHGRDGARLRPASDAFLLSRIARAVVDALDDHDQGAVSRCECGFAGTDVTENARCGCCGKLVDDESLRWLVSRALGGQ